jgi:hypothetical protein
LLFNGYKSPTKGAVSPTAIDCYAYWLGLNLREN